jgi:hypothetical protein
MFVTLLASLSTSAAKSARSCGFVFELESQRLGIGHGAGSDFDAPTFYFSTGKSSIKKIADLLANRALTAASDIALATENKSARFVQLAESQMKRKASATFSPFGQGLLLGRGAFLF